MAFPYSLKKEMCRYLTRSGKCRIGDECVYVKIPLPWNNLPESWEKTWEYIESASSSCPQQGNDKVNKWLKEVQKKLQNIIKIKGGEFL